MEMVSLEVGLTMVLMIEIFLVISGSAVIKQSNNRNQIFRKIRKV